MGIPSSLGSCGKQLAEGNEGDTFVSIRIGQRKQENVRSTNDNQNRRPGSFEIQNRARSHSVVFWSMYSRPVESHTGLLDSTLLPLSTLPALATLTTLLLLVGVVWWLSTILLLLLIAATIRLLAPLSGAAVAL